MAYASIALFLRKKKKVRIVIEAMELNVIGLRMSNFINRTMNTYQH